MLDISNSLCSSERIIGISIFYVAKTLALRNFVREKMSVFYYVRTFISRGENDRAKNIENCHRTFSMVKTVLYRNFLSVRVLYFSRSLGCHRYSSESWELGGQSQQGNNGMGKRLAN